MNKTIIKQLSDQAKAQVPHGISVDKWIETYNEKFAELIIRECATLTLDPMQIDEAQYYHGWLDYRDKIWKHFGVGY